MADRYTVVPFSPLRKIIATARMVEAEQAIPHCRMGVDIELDALLALRAWENAEHSELLLSINDCILKVSASALMQHQQINIKFIDGVIHQYHHADVSAVIAVEGGLVTPVVRSANSKSVRDIAQEVRELSARAVRGRLKMDEILGGSFFASNLCAHGVDEFDAIVNQPPVHRPRRRSCEAADDGFSCWRSLHCQCVSGYPFRRSQRHLRRYGSEVHDLVVRRVGAATCAVSDLKDRRW